MIVRNKRWKDGKTKKNKIQSKDSSAHIFLAVGLFMTEMNETV